VRQVGGNDHHLARAQRDFLLVAGAEPEAQRPAQDIRELLVLVGVSRDLLAALEVYVRDHHALARDQLAAQPLLQLLGG
jgi:hypothetical protein